MSFNKRAIDGIFLFALVAGGIALAATAPASAAAVDAAHTKVTIPGDRLEGPWIMTNDVLMQNDPASAYQYVTEVTSGLRYDPHEGGASRETAISWASLASFPAVGTTGLVKVGNFCVTEATPVTLSTCVPGSPEQTFATHTDGTLTFPKVPGTYLQLGGYAFASNMVQIVTADVTGGQNRVERLDLTALTPRDAECTEGLTAMIETVNTETKSVTVSGTGKPGETITVTGTPGHPAGPFTAVVAANGSWVVTISNLVEGENPYYVFSSDNCTSLDLSVILGSLETPIMHPTAAAAAGVLGLCALGFGRLLHRRNTSHI